MYNSSISTVCLYSNQQYYGCYRLTIQTPPLKQLVRKAGRKQSHSFFALEIRDLRINTWRIINKNPNDSELVIGCPSVLASEYIFETSLPIPKETQIKRTVKNLCPHQAPPGKRTVRVHTHAGAQIMKSSAEHSLKPGHVANIRGMINPAWIYLHGKRTLKVKFLTTWHMLLLPLLASNLLQKDDCCLYGCSETPSMKGKPACGFTTCGCHSQVPNYQILH